MEKKATTRVYYLDWLRVLGILVVFVYHSSRFFNVEEWNVKNPVWYPWVEVWNRFATAWMMPLMFVISGASLFYALGKGSGAGKFVKDKVLRLLVPLVVGALHPRVAADVPGPPDPRRVQRHLFPVSAAVLFRRFRLARYALVVPAGPVSGQYHPLSPPALAKGPRPACPSWATCWLCRGRSMSWRCP